MKNLYSIWLVPQKSDEQYLEKIINKLALDYSAPSFIPHLTLFTEKNPSKNISLEKLQQIINAVFKHQQPFEITKTGIGQSDYFWKTVFLEFELNETLRRLFESISEKTDKRDISLFKPHISLIYKTLTKEERIKIAESVQSKNKFILDKVFVNIPKEGDNDFSDIENWRHLYKKTLNNL